jgi:hypothetical protein
MANTQVTVHQAILAAKLNEQTVGDTAPTTPVTGDLWVNTGPATPELLVRQSGAFWPIPRRIVFGNTTAQTFTGTGQNITGWNAVTLNALAGLNACYEIELDASMNAGGASVKDLLISWTRVSGTGTMTVLQYSCESWLNAAGGFVNFSPSSTTTQIDFHGVGAIGAAGLTSYVRAHAIFYMTGTADFRMVASRSGGEAGDPNLNRMHGSLTMGARFGG